MNAAAPSSDSAGLSRRERQIMDALFALREATVQEVRAKLPDPPTPTAVRTLLAILETKRQVRCRKRGRENLYRPISPRRAAGRSALRRVVQTFFAGSFEQAVGAYLAGKDRRLSDEELQRLAALIETARRRE